MSYVITSSSVCVKEGYCSFPSISVARLLKKNHLPINSKEDIQLENSSQPPFSFVIRIRDKDLTLLLVLKKGLLN